MDNSAVFISLEEFKATLQSLHDAIFSGEEYSEELEDRLSPFVDKTWEKVLIPEQILGLEDIDFRALNTASMSMGDGQVFVTESESLPHYERTFKVAWNQEELKKLRWTSNIGLFELHAFGRSGTWGLMCYYDDYSLLGGTPAFMEAFFEAAGGRQQVRDRFVSHAMSGWVIEPPYQVRILRTVGWTFNDQPS